ncbi:hypothetical protein MANES_11G110350v8 [Manihot esculenta]|uniref:Uncharacterized protein n=1 Tax=Manihot esculenta TaxID=3983 RepID=A0ACB7GX92_MANES|nr:hypothetical protein MANES_11G110350v8 [Manihot esculenta]
MASSSSLVSISLFTGENYQVWEVKIKAYLRSLALWTTVEEDRDPPPLGNNPTVNQIQMHEAQVTKKDKALKVLHTGVADHIFTSIMACKTPKEIGIICRKRTRESSIVEKILISITERFEFKISTIEEAQDVTKLSVADLISELHVREQ